MQVERGIVCKRCKFSWLVCVFLFVKSVMRAMELMEQKLKESNRLLRANKILKEKFKVQKPSKLQRRLKEHNIEMYLFPNIFLNNF